MFVIHGKQKTIVMKTAPLETTPAEIQMKRMSAIQILIAVHRASAPALEHAGVFNSKATANAEAATRAITTCATHAGTEQTHSQIKESAIAEF